MLVGRNVLYVDGKGETHAALITKDHGGGMVNLTWFPDVNHSMEVRAVAATSVKYSEDTDLYNTWHYL